MNMKNNITITSKQLEDIQNLLKVQANNISDEYMTGLYNGMELIASIVEKRDPIFASKITSGESTKMERKSK